MKLTISLINNEIFVNKVAAEISNLFDSLVNSCSTMSDIQLAIVTFTALANKETATLNYILPLVNNIINEMTNNEYDEAEVNAEEMEEIRDLIACHAVVYLTLLES